MKWTEMLILWDELKVIFYKSNKKQARIKSPLVLLRKIENKDFLSQAYLNVFRGGMYEPGIYC